MKKINLKDYVADIAGIKKTFKVKESVLIILFDRSNEYNAYGLREANKVADKIEKAKDSVILEDKEYEVLRNSFEKFKGFGKHEVTLIDRVLDAEDYELKTKK